MNWTYWPIVSRPSMISAPPMASTSIAASRTTRLGSGEIALDRSTNARLRRA